jgi:septum site-determining protein MinC
LKTKQYTAKIFEVELEDESSFFSFFDKNYLFFQNSLIVIKGEESDGIKKYLDDKELKYIFNLAVPTQKKKQTSFETHSKIEEKKPEPLTKTVEKVVQKSKTNLKVLDKLIRSGQEINVDGDLLLLNRVNSGGSIIVNGTLIVTQIVDGSIRCSGDFMMLQASSKANIVFHEVEVDNKLLQERLNRIELINNEIIITPALKEKNWV